MITPVRPYISGVPLDPEPHHDVDPSFRALPLAALADAALSRARRLGAEHADLRVEQIITQELALRDGVVEHLADSTVLGLAVRVIVDGVWGFAAHVELTPERAAATAERAVSVARTLAPVAVAAASAGSGPARLRSLLLALSIVPPLATAAFALARQEALLGFLAAGQAVAAAIAIAAATLDERIAQRGPPAIAGLLVALAVPWSSAAPVRSALTGEPVVSTLREHDLAGEHVRTAGFTRPGESARPLTIAPGTPPPPAAGAPRLDFEVRGGALEVTRFTRTARRLALDADSETGGIIATSSPSASVVVGSA